MDRESERLHLATPNPFQSEKKIAYLPLSAETPVRGNGVLSASLRPTDVENAHSLAAPLQDFSRGEVIDCQFYRESAAGERELLLFNQQVLPGQSGSPLVSAETQGVVGIVVGRWLRPTVIPSGANGDHLTMSPGAALRIHYAIGLLEQLHITWNRVSISAILSATDDLEGTQVRGAFGKFRRSRRPACGYRRARLPNHQHR
jgi:hypothetical protein